MGSMTGAEEEREEEKRGEERREKRGERRGEERRGGHAAIKAGVPDWRFVSLIVCI